MLRGPSGRASCVPPGMASVQGEELQQSHPVRHGSLWFPPTSPEQFAQRSSTLAAVSKRTLALCSGNCSLPASHELGRWL